MKTFDQTCRTIDWSALSKQKQTLLLLVSYLNGNITRKEDEMNVKAFLRSLKKNAKNLDGIISLIDGLQDAAVDVHGVPESEVFPSLKLIRKSA